MPFKSTLYKKVKETLSKCLKKEQECYHAGIWGKSILGRGTSQYKEPEACRVCLSNSEEVSVVSVK